MDDHWRNSQKISRFFVFDARLFFVVMACMVWIAAWTAALTVIMFLTFWAFEKRGLTFEAALRGFRAWILGQDRPATTRLLRRRYIDDGG